MDNFHKAGFGKKTFAIVLATATLCWGIGFAMFGPVLLNTAEAAATTAHPNGVLVDIGDANHTVYLITGGQRQGIPSPTVFASYGYSFDKVVPANSYDQALPEGEVMKYADGTLVNDNGTIFLIGNGQKRGFTTADVYTGLGYSFTGSSVVVPEDIYTATFAEYTGGAVIDSADEAHPNGALVDVNGTVFQIDNGTLVGIPSEAVFGSHGLSWDNVVPSNAADQAMTVGANMKFADGTLVLDTTGTPTVFVISDGIKLGVTTPEALEAYGYAWGNLVDGDVSSYEGGATITDDGTTDPVVVTGTNTVALAASSPAASVVARGAQDVVFAEYTFTADSAGYTISSMSITRGGISADADITAVKLYNGTTQVGSTQALNTTTHKAGFTGLSVAVPANGSTTLTVKGNIYATASVGDSIQLGIAAASDITATATIAGTFPIMGAAKNVATVAVGVFDVDRKSTPATNANMLSGSTDQAIAGWTFAADSVEGFSVNSIKVTNTGSAGDSDFSNIKLKYNATELATATNMTNSAVTFTLATPLEVKASQTKSITAYCDVSAGITTSRTIIFEITRAEDVSATGSNSGGNVTVTASGSTYSKQTGNTMTIGQGTLVTALDTTTNPSVQDYVVGTEGNLMAALKFSTGSREGARVTQITLTLTGTATDISNICLYDRDTDELIGSCGSIVGTTVQFGTNTINAYDSTGLFDVASSSNKYVTVKADVPSGANASNTLKLAVAAASDIKADGLTSQNDIPSASITGTAAGQTHTIGTSGTLTLTASGDTPSAATISKGTEDNLLAKFDLTANSGEDIIIGSIKITLQKGSGGSTDMVVGDATNIDIYDGTTLLGTDASPITDSTFAVNLTVPKSTTKVLSVYADIPSTSTASYAAASIAATADVDVTGAASSATTSIVSGTPAGSTHTVSTGSLTAKMSTSPIFASVTANVTDLVVGQLVLTAGTAEDIDISQVKIHKPGIDGATKSVTNATITAMKLFDGSTQIGDSISGGNFSSSKAVFSGTNFPITVPKGTSKTLTVKVSLNSSATGNIIVGVENYIDDISATGASSTATVYANYLGVADTAEAAGDGTETNFAAELATIIAAGEVAAGDTITIGTEHMLVAIAAMTGTGLIRGINGSTAATFAADAVVVKRSSTKVIGNSNNLSVNGDTAVTFASSIDGTIANGDLVTLHDSDTVSVASADDAKLVTAINSTALTLTMTDAYIGAAFTEATSPDNGAGDDIVIVHDNYGQALVIATVGTLAVDVATNNPVASQVVAGTSDVEFTKISFTADHEDIVISKLVLTTAATSLRNLSSVKVTYEDSTGATVTKSEDNPSGTTVTFNFATGEEIYCVEDVLQTITISADVRTVAAGAVSADAPTFYIATVNTTNLVSQGASTGTALSTYSSTTAPTSGNVTAKTIYKTKLTVATSTSSPVSAVMGQSNSKKLAQFTLINSSNAANQDATFTSFKVTLDRNNVTADNFKLYRADTGAQIGSTVIHPAAADDSVTFTVSSNNTIAPGETNALDVYVKAGVHNQGAGTTLSGSIQVMVSNIASGGDITWGDGTTTNITWVDITNQTSIEDTGTFSFSSGSDSYAPYLIGVVITDVASDANATTSDTVKFIYSEPMKDMSLSGAADDVESETATDIISFMVNGGTGASLGVMTLTSAADDTTTGASGLARTTTIQSNDSVTVTLGAGMDAAVTETTISVVADITVAAMQDAASNALSDVTTAVTAALGSVTGTFDGS